MHVEVFWFSACNLYNSVQSPSNCLDVLIARMITLQSSLPCSSFHLSLHLVFPWAKKQKDFYSSYSSFLKPLSLLQSFRCDVCSKCSGYESIESLSVSVFMPALLTKKMSSFCSPHSSAILSEWYSVLVMLMKNHYSFTVSHLYEKSPEANNCNCSCNLLLLLCQWWQLLRSICVCVPRINANVAKWVQSLHSISIFQFDCIDHTGVGV